MTDATETSAISVHILCTPYSFAIAPLYSVTIQNQSESKYFIVI